MPRTTILTIPLLFCLGLIATGCKINNKNKANATRNEARNILDKHQQKLNDLTGQFQQLEQSVKVFDEAVCPHADPGDPTRDSLDDGVWTAAFSIAVGIQPS